MRRFWAGVLLLAASVAPASALDLSSIPSKFPITWGSSAGSAYVRSIPVPSQIGVQNCAASLTDGFPPLTFVPASAGGCPPFGQDFNGILRQVTQWGQWQQAGGPIFYDSAFAAAIGGYPGQSVLLSAVTPGTMWLSTVNNNATDPDDGGAGWVQLPSQVPIGTPVPALSSAVPGGYAPANGLTIGDASSNGTGRANADTKFLFAYVWANCPAAQCPIFTSGGGGSTRGATAAADYAAHKALATWNLSGAGLMGADRGGSTFLAGVPVTSGSATVPGSIVGENLHALISGENGTHSHVNTLTDPGHSHVVPISDPGHVHTNGLTDPGHVHAVAVTDPGHAHTNNISQAQFPISSGGSGPFIYGASLGGGASSGLVNTAVTNISASATNHVSNVTITNASAQTGILAGANPNFAAITINNANSGSGTGHNTVERSVLVYWNLKL